MPVVLLAMWDLEAEMLDSDFLSGVVPVLFSESPSASEAALRADQARAIKDIEALNRVYFIPEVIDLDEALKVVRKPRLGDCDYAFKSQNLERLLQPQHNYTSLTGIQVLPPLLSNSKHYIITFEPSGPTPGTSGSTARPQKRKAGIVFFFSFTQIHPNDSHTNTTYKCVTGTELFVSPSVASTTQSIDEGKTILLQ